MISLRKKFCYFVVIRNILIIECRRLKYFMKFSNYFIFIKSESVKLLKVSQLGYVRVVRLYYIGIDYHAGKKYVLNYNYPIINNNNFFL